MKPHRLTTVAIVSFVLGAALFGSGRARAAWEPIARFLSLRGAPQPASANVLSEHETEGLDSMPAQNQAELLLERSINR